MSPNRDGLSGGGVASGVLPGPAPPVCYPRGTPSPCRYDATRPAKVVSYLPLDVADQLARRADANGLTVSAMAAALIKLALENVVDDRPADPEPRSPVDDARRVREDPEYAAWLRARRG